MLVFLINVVLVVFSKYVLVVEDDLDVVFVVCVFLNVFGD